VPFVDPSIPEFSRIGGYTLPATLTSASLLLAELGFVCSSTCCVFLAFLCRLTEQGCRLHSACVVVVVVVIVHIIALGLPAIITEKAYLPTNPGRAGWDFVVVFRFSLCGGLVAFVSAGSEHAVRDERGAESRGRAWVGLLGGV